MKRITKFAVSRVGTLCIFFIVLLVTCISFIGTSREEVHYQNTRSAKVYINGASNVGNWRLEVGEFACNANLVLQDNELYDVKALVLALPVDRFTSTDPQLEVAIQELFKSNMVNEIRFIKSHQMVLPIMKKIHLVGELSMGATSRPMDISLDFTVNKDQSINLSGTKAIKLSEYGIRMPDLLMGSVKYRDEVEIDFDLTLKKGMDFGHNP